MSSKFKTHFIKGLEDSSIPKLKVLADKMVLETANFEILEFRSLQLNHLELSVILDTINNFSEPFSLRSISFSFNTTLADRGAIILANQLPSTIENLGLVGCNIADKGAKAILKWIKKATALQMICIENNPISVDVKQKYRSYFKEHSTKLLVI